MIGEHVIQLGPHLKIVQRETRVRVVCIVNGKEWLSNDLQDTFYGREIKCPLYFEDEASAHHYAEAAAAYIRLAY